MTSTEFMTNWLREAKSLYFFLPDGPYGRPFDNMYSFQSLSAEGNSVAILLSDGIMLRFLGGITFEDRHTKLIITGFQELEFSVQGRIVSSYEGGEVTLTRF